MDENPVSEYEQSMIDVVDTNEKTINDGQQSDADLAAQATPDPDEEEGSLLAGKYKNVEDLEKAYTELQSKLGANTTPSAEDTVVATTDEATEAVQAAGLDISSLESEYETNGQLSDQSYKSLEDAGISRAVVDQYTAGQLAMQQTFADSVQAEVGGEAAYNDMVAWASQNLSETEQQAFNASIDDEATAKFAVKGLHSLYKTANPKLIGGSTTSGSFTNSGGYDSQTDMMQAIGSRAYKTDSSYRAKVQSKIAKSNF